MKRVLATLLSAVGLSRPDTKGHEVQSIDPSKILFSVPTISDDLAPCEEVAPPLPDSAFTLHEDDWCKVEFYAASRMQELKRMLTEYKAFEAQNRTSSGWKNVFLRRVERSPVLEGGDALHRLEGFLGSKAGGAPVLHSTMSLTGQVVGGFTISLGGNIVLYGCTSSEGIPVLAASVGEHPDDQVLTQAFALLHNETGLILVDWINQFMLVGVDGGGQLEVWRA